MGSRSASSRALHHAPHCGGALVCLHARESECYHWVPRTRRPSHAVATFTPTPSPMASRVADRPHDRLCRREEKQHARLNRSPSSAKRREMTLQACRSPSLISLRGRAVLVATGTPGFCWRHATRRSLSIQIGVLVWRLCGQHGRGPALSVRACKTRAAQKPTPSTVFRVVVGESRDAARRLR